MDLRPVLLLYCIKMIIRNSETNGGILSCFNGIVKIVSLFPVF